MKNNKIWLGILAMTLVFGITVVSCSSDDGGGPTGGNAFITGSRYGALTITGQVWEVDFSTSTWAHYDGAGSPHTIVCENVGGTGTISDTGVLSFTITPADITGATLEPFNTGFGFFITDELGGTISVNDVQYASLRLRDGASSFWLFRGYESYEEVSTTNYNFLWDFVEFIYVDRDVVISHPGGASPPESDISGGFTTTWNQTVTPFRVYLQQGWNNIRIHVTGTYREPTTTTGIYTTTVTVHADNPTRLKWLKD